MPLHLCRWSWRLVRLVGVAGAAMAGVRVSAGASMGFEKGATDGGFQAYQIAGLGLSDVRLTICKRLFSYLFDSATVTASFSAFPALLSGVLVLSVAVCVVLFVIGR